MALILDLNVDPKVEIVVVSSSVIVRAIRRNRKLLDEAHGTGGCNYQKLFAEMNDDKDLTVGLPCYECRKIIEIGEQCVSRRANRTRKYYDMTCARKKNLI